MKIPTAATDCSCRFFAYGTEILSKSGIVSKNEHKSPFPGLSKRAAFSSFDTSRISSWIQERTPSLSTIEKVFSRSIFAFGVGMVLFNVYTFFDERQKYLELSKKEQLTPEAKKALLDARRNMQIEGISLIGTTASAIDWGQEAQLLSLGGFKAPVQGVNRGATLLVSGMRTLLSFRFLRESYEKFKNRVPEVKTQIFIEKNRIALLDMASYSASTAWAVSELSALIFGFALNPILSAVLILLSVGLGVASVFYKIHVEKQHKKVA